MLFNEYKVYYDSKKIKVQGIVLTKDMRENIKEVNGELIIDVPDEFLLFILTFEKNDKRNDKENNKENAKENCILTDIYVGNGLIDQTEQYKKELLVSKDYQAIKEYSNRIFSQFEEFFSRYNKIANQYNNANKFIDYNILVFGFDENNEPTVFLKATKYNTKLVDKILDEIENQIEDINDTMINDFTT